VENATEERPRWKECTQYNITVEIQAIFNGSDYVVVKQVNGSLLSSEGEVLYRNSSSIRDVILNYNLTLSHTFELTFHPEKGIVKAEPCSKITLEIEIEINEHYGGQWTPWKFTKPIEITICP